MENVELANVVHLAKLKEGVRAWNRWRAEHPGGKPDLFGAQLLDAHLFRVDLSRANLTSIYLRGADLRHADLHLADLSDANLRRANLRGAILAGTNLHRADLFGAILNGAVLSRARNLTQEQLEGAKGDADTLLPEALERPVHWLEELLHRRRRRSPA